MLTAWLGGAYNALQDSTAGCGGEEMGIRERERGGRGRVKEGKGGGRRGMKREEWE